MSNANWKNKDEDNNSINKGKASYDQDGTLKRLDNFSPSSNNPDKHHHEWLKKNADGSFSYGHGEHDNH